MAELKTQKTDASVAEFLDMAGFARHAALMKRLGRHTTGKSCLYVKRLEELDLDVLRQLIEESVVFMRARSGPGSGCV